VKNEANVAEAEVTAREAAAEAVITVVVIEAAAVAIEAVVEIEAAAEAVLHLRITPATNLKFQQNQQPLNLLPLNNEVRSHKPVVKISPIG